MKVSPDFTLALNSPFIIINYWQQLLTGKDWHVWKVQEQTPQDFDNLLNSIDHLSVFHKSFGSEYRNWNLWNPVSPHLLNALLPLFLLLYQGSGISVCWKKSSHWIIFCNYKKKICQPHGVSYLSSHHPKSHDYPRNILLFAFTLVMLQNDTERQSFLIGGLECGRG